MDITLDQNTLDYMSHGMHDGWDNKNKVRVAARAKQYITKAGKLYKRADGKFPTDRPVPVVDERLHIMTELHKPAHCGVGNLRKLVSKQY